MKNLIAKRDAAALAEYESAQRWYDKFSAHPEPLPSYPYGIEIGFKQGYDQCIKDLMPEAEKLVECIDYLLHRIQKYECTLSHHSYTCIDAKNSLSRWREFVGEP